MLRAVTAYEDPRFVPFALGSIAVSTVAFIAFAGPLTWLAARDPAWARRYRLQSRPAREQQLVGRSIGWWVANNILLAMASSAAFSVRFPPLACCSACSIAFSRRAASHLNAVG